jgi:D-alanyl-D-alanine carboxypeptidase
LERLQPSIGQKRPLRALRPALLIAGTLLAGHAHAGPYLLVEANSGRVIVQSDAGRPWYPASVTKLMTVYVAFHAMRENKVAPSTLLKVSANALAQPPSKMGFNVGTEITLDNAIKMLMVRSANDIAVVIAEGVSGSVETFVADMNRTAARLGMDGTRYANPHGLPDENQVTTARDMAILGRAIMRDFPEYELYFRIPALQLGKRIIRNHNRLIDHYPGADGMKTGFICSSGFNVVAGATRNGKRLIAVVFGAYSASQRAEDAARLFERGFRRDMTLLPDSHYALLDHVGNQAGAPEDLREQMCNAKRKRPAAESDIDDDDDEDEVAAASGTKGPAKAKQVKQSLLVDLPPSMPPIRVFTGPVLKLPETNLGTAAKEKDTKTEKAASASPKSEAKQKAATTSDAKPKPAAASATAAAKPAAKPVIATPAQGSNPPAKPKN